MNLKIGNELTPPKAVQKMKEVAAGMHRLESDAETRTLELCVPEHWIYKGAATVGEFPIDGSAISPIYDTAWNVQNMLITLLGGRDLLIPHAPLDAGFGPLNDGSGAWVFTDEWTHASAINDTTTPSVASEGLCRLIKALLDRTTTIHHLVGHRTLR